MAKGADDLKTSIYSDDNNSAPSAVVKRDPTPEEMPGLLDFLATEVGFITCVLDEDKMNTFSPTGVWEWDEYQLECLECGEWYISNKCRQSGVSTVFSGKAFARGTLSANNYNAIFTSFKKEEAVNKINYVRQFLEALPPSFRKKIIRAPLQLIEWENNNGTRAKIMSHAQRPIRGINGDIFLDELAFYQLADEIYTSALPAVAAVRGTIDVTSTPFGKAGKFYEIISNVEKYPKFQRHQVMWWVCKRYLKRVDDEFLAKAMIEAPKLSLEERVYAFGNEWLIDQYLNADTDEDFLQEFEGHFVDEQAAFFHRQLILDCMFNNHDTDIGRDYDPRENDFKDLSIEDALGREDDIISLIESRYKGVKTRDGRPIHFQKYDSIEELYAAVRSGRVTNILFGGADIGKSQHSTHFVILEEVELASGETLQIERFSLNKGKWDLHDQQAYFDQIISQGFLRKLRIDRTGLGEQMVGYLESKWPGVVEGIHMGGNNSKQESHMVNLRARMENKGIALAYDKRTIEDLYSIKRVVSSSKSVSYRADSKGKHHADAAWAIAFASLCGTPFGDRPAQYSMQDLSGVGNKKLSRDLGIVSPPSFKDKLSSFSGVSSQDRALFKSISNPGGFVKNWDKS
jgi:phage FluMu gp28-like protein